MKPSNYNLFLKYPDSSKAVLFNTLYGSMLLLEDSEIEKVSNILSKLPVDEMNSEIGSTLINEKFIIKDDTNEIQIINHRKQKGIRDKNRLDIIFMPTLNCNFSCIYCYEKHVTSSMSDIVEESINKWLINEIPKFKYVLVHWFGGEPLLELNRITNISNTIREIANKNKIGFSLQVTTNGFFLTKKNAQKLIKSGINNFQITLDGTREYHDKLRIQKNGNPTYNVIFKNIVNLLEFNNNLKISLRINFNHTNIDSIPELLTQFPESIRKKIRIAFEPIFGNCSINAVNNINHSDLSEKLSMYYKLADRLGYDVTIGMSQVITGKLVYCYAERINQFVVNYNGDIFKCSVCDFDKNDRVGFINTLGKFVKINTNISKWLQGDLFEEKCLHCVYLPLCMGGCKKLRIEGKDTGSNCFLVPTNTSHLLKQIAFNGLSNLIKKEVL